MNPVARIRLAIILIASTLLGTLIVAVLLLLHGTWRTGAVITNTTVQTQSGRQSVTWMLTAHRLVGIQVTASDPAYSRVWADESMWRQGKRWDRITVTVGDKNGSFVLEYNARAGMRGTSGGSGVGSETRTLDFRGLQPRGYVPSETVLGRFTLETQQGQIVEGTVTLVEVTEELLHPSKRSDATELPQQEAH